MKGYREYTGKFYRLLHPRITVLVVSRCPNNRINVMPASWNTPVSEEPPTIGIAISNDSYTKECIDHFDEVTVNVPSVEQIDIVYALGKYSGREVDKVSKFNLRLIDSKSVRVPGIDDSLAIYEGKVKERVTMGDVTFYIIEVLRVIYKEGLADEYGFDFNSCNVLLHGAGRAFYKVDAKRLSAKR